MKIESLSTKQKMMVSVGVGVVCFFLGGSYLKRAENKIKNQFKMTTVLQAKKYIAEGKLVEPGYLEEVAIPKMYLPPMAIQEKKELSNSQGDPLYRARTSFLKGEFISKARLVDPASERSLAWALAPGQTAITLKLSLEQCVGAHIQPGDFVNVYCTLDQQPGVPNDHIRLLLPRVLVLAVDDRIWEDSGSPSKRNLEMSGSLEHHFVTLAVSPDDAGRVALAFDKGRLIFSLISPLDMQIHKMSPLKLADIK